MTLDLTFGAIVTVGLLFNLIYALVRLERFRSQGIHSHDLQWLAADRNLLRSADTADQTHRRLHDPRLQRGAYRAVARASPARTGPVPLRAVRQYTHGGLSRGGVSNRLPPMALRWTGAAMLEAAKEFS
jgi:hypothetical protein